MPNFNGAVAAEVCAASVLAWKHSVLWFSMTVVLLHLDVQYVCFGLLEVALLCRRYTVPGSIFLCRELFFGRPPDPEQAAQFSKTPQCDVRVSLARPVHRPSYSDMSYWFCVCVLFCFVRAGRKEQQCRGELRVRRDPERVGGR